MFTGQEIFVGLTKRTNQKGISSLQQMFPSYKVRTFDLANIIAVARDRAKSNSSSSCVIEEVLHLKSFCSMCGDDTVLVGGAVGEVFADMINKREGCPAAPAGSSPPPVVYKIVKVPDTEAANCVYLSVHDKTGNVTNKTMIRRAGFEFPASDEVFRTPGELDPRMIQIEVEAGELAKVDGALTCCSLLF